MTRAAPVVLPLPQCLPNRRFGLWGQPVGHEVRLLKERLLLHHPCCLEAQQQVAHAVGTLQHPELAQQHPQLPKFRAKRQGVDMSPARI